MPTQPKTMKKNASPKPRKRDEEKIVPLKTFVATLRRVADVLEKGDSLRIQVGGQRVLIPKEAVVSIEHEVEGKEQEVEFQLRWSTSTKKPKAGGSRPKPVTVSPSKPRPKSMKGKGLSKAKSR